MLAGKLLKTAFELEPLLASKSKATLTQEANEMLQTLASAYQEKASGEFSDVIGSIKRVLSEGSNCGFEERVKIAEKGSDHLNRRKKKYRLDAL
jgi:hypothetical protein